MAKERKSTVIFEKYVTKLMDDKLRKIEAQINELDENDSIEEIAKLISEANSWISMICGEDTQLYENWRFHLFISPSGNVVYFRGTEIDVDYRSWHEKGNG